MISMTLLYMLNPDKHAPPASTHSLPAHVPKYLILWLRVSEGGIVEPIDPRAKSLTAARLVAFMDLDILGRGPRRYWTWDTGN